MRRHAPRRWLPILLPLAILILPLVFLASAKPVSGQTPTFRVLVFSKTAGFRHDSIPNGIQAIQSLGTANNFAVDATEDAAVFNTANLAQYQAVIFLSTTGDVLNATQQTAFEQYIRSGRGFVGIHAASDTEYSWPWYGSLVGAYFSNHPAIQQATTEVADRAHPSSAPLPKQWVRTDEWYSFQTNPRGTVHVLATLDEATYSGGTMGFDHPLAWCQNYDGGRSWYTGAGHTQASFTESAFLSHMLGGIRWAAGNVAGDCGATVNARFQKVILDDNTVNPMELATAPDGRVFFAERAGTVKIYKPSTSSTVTAGTLSVFTGNEDGLLGITLDPNFATNNWLYLFYSPAAGSPRQHVSRFTVNGDTLNLASEQVLLQIPTQRDECCHSGGSLTFGPGGTLFISLGDNTNPFDSSGYTPIDERAGRSAWDAQKSASNTQDLRGKILRIVPQANGTYTIPSGNLFTTAAAGRPEIFSMGHRNPFRIAVDSANSWLYWGEVGPDASADSATRGPKGHDEWNQARTAGNYGWPYCIANNKQYNDFNFATSTSGALFNCAAPTNNSPNNTGPQSLPAARSALIWYPYGASPEFPEITDGGGRTAMGGPIYHYNAALVSDRKLPAYYDNTMFIYEWSRNWIREVKFDDSGNLLKINPFVPTFSFNRPMDMEIGPDGAIYMIEWGTGFGGGNPDSQLVRIDYIAGNRAPIAKGSATPTSGSVPLAVSFSSAGSSDPDGDAITFAWDFTSNGSTDSTAANPSFTYTTAGNYTARLTVTDSKGAPAVVNIPIAAGNNTPVVTISAPPQGGFFSWSDAVHYDASVTDAQDGSTPTGIPCSRVDVKPAIGHDDHAHDGTPSTGCSGDLLIPGGHDYGNVFYVIRVSYTDNGAPGVGPLTGETVRTLQPKRKEAEFFTSNNGVQLEATGDTAGGGQNIAFIDHGDWISFTPMNLLNISSLTYRVASAGTGGTIEVRVGSSTGTLISTATIPVTGAWQTYTNVTVPITNPGGTNELFFVFKRNAGDLSLFNINWIDFNGAGVSFPPNSTSNGTGLTGDYYDNMDFTGAKVTRTDATVNFNWGSGVPVAGIGADTFSTRWTGQVQPQFSETYTFYTTSDDGVRLWVNGTQVINNWTDHGPTENSGTIALVGGQKYDIRMEYHENGGAAVATLSWSSPSQAKQIIPQTRLYPGNGAVALARINSGGAAVAPFAADANFSGGTVNSTTTAVTTVGVPGPAPAAVYQSERYGNMTYTFGGLVAGSSYTVRLHFAEIHWTAAGQRVFDVSINGTQVLNDLDIFAAAGGNFKAIVREFTATANGSGQIVIQYTTVVDNAKSSGIEVYGAPTPNGIGLKGDYYDNMNFTGTLVTRTDATVNFNWGSGVPVAGIAADTFSTRWTGRVQPQFSETYTFYTTSDDGVRLWVNGTQVINNWTDHGPTENSGTIALVGGQKYDVLMEYYENGGGATATLSWSSPSQAKQIIPQARLYNTVGTSTLALGTAAPTAATTAPAAAPPRQAAVCDHPYYPLRQGAAWAYTISGLGPLPVQETRSIRAVANTLRDARADIRSSIGSAAADNQIVCADGALRLAAFPQLTNRPNDPLAGFTTLTAEGTYLLGADKLVLGATWSARYTLAGTITRDGQAINVTAEVIQTFEVLGAERVVVPAGSFTALRVRQLSRIVITEAGAAQANPEILIEQTNWYAQGVGIVKSTTPIAMLAETTTELVGFNRP